MTTDKAKKLTPGQEVEDGHGCHWTIIAAGRDGATVERMAWSAEPLIGWYRHQTPTEVLRIDYMKLAACAVVKRKEPK